MDPVVDFVNLKWRFFSCSNQEDNQMIYSAVVEGRFGWDDDEGNWLVSWGLNDE